MNPEILQRAKNWSECPAFDPKDREEIASLLKDLNTNETELTERFYRGLEFGTGGMRGILGQGENRINRYTVRRAAQALAETILKYHPHGASIVVAYDSRHGSRTFAEETLSVMAAFGIRGKIFPDLTPTPMLSFAIRTLKAQGGVMVTASHNPPKYNGYKVFWSDGAQVVPPVDQEIIRRYEALGDWENLKSMPFATATQRGLVQDVGPEVNEAFYKTIEEEVILQRDLCLKSGGELKVVFTPLHGTGTIPCETIMKRLGFKNFKTLEAQRNPDSNFSTVKYPNPEDPAALKLAVDEMLKTNADLVLGTDPDCDRLGVVVNHRGTPVYVNGNQLGVLMLDYIFKTRKKLGKLPSKPLVVKSIVTTPLQDTIVSKFQGKTVATLTGFKWMASAIGRLEKEHPELHFLFASEESFGYMPNRNTRDKDGVSSVALMSELALALKLQKATLVDALDKLADEYGFFQEHLVSMDYEGIEGAAKIKRIMDSFRGNVPKDIGGDAIVKVQDFKKTDETGLPSSDVLGFHFKSGGQLFLRPSGTEPKIKFYIMVNSKDGTLDEKKKLATQKIALIEEYLRSYCEKV